MDSRCESFAGRVPHQRPCEEDAVGAALFLHAPQGMALTDLGCDLLPEAGSMAAAAAALERTASAPLDAGRGLVRLTASEVVGAEVPPGVLAPLLAAHPGLEVELVLPNRSEDLLWREADLAVRMVRPVQTELVARKLAEVRIGLCAHARYLAAHGVPKTPGDLAGHILIGPDRDAATLAAMATTGLDRRMLRLRCNREAAQLNALRAGLGIGAAKAGGRIQQLFPAEAGRSLQARCHAKVSALEAQLGVSLSAEERGFLRRWLAGIARDGASVRQGS